MPIQGQQHINRKQVPSHAAISPSMQCSICERRQRKFYCANCVSTNISEFRLSCSRVEGERADLVARANAFIKQLEPVRLERAQRSSLIQQTKEIRKEVERLRLESREARERLAASRERLSIRRKNLASANELSRAPQTLTPLTAAQSELDNLADRLSISRRGLSLILARIFDLKQEQDGNVTICSLTFPFPGDHRKNSIEHTNGVITLTLHFLNLLVSYLGVKLPFQVSWSGGPFGAGKPTIRAGGGSSDDGEWVKWTVKQPLYVTTADLSRPAPTVSSFTSAISMIAFNVLYLLHTQSVPLPTSFPPSILHDLLRLCLHQDLGRRSHSTRPHLPPPTHGLKLEFATLLEAAKEADGSKRAEERTREGDRDADADWHFIDEDT